MSADDILRERELEVIDHLLGQWRAGHTWMRFQQGARSFVDPGTDELESAYGDLDPSDPSYWDLARVRGFLDYFILAVTHGDKDLYGIPWEEAFPLLQETRDRLARGEPIEDLRLLLPDLGNAGCSLLAIGLPATILISGVLWLTGRVVVWALTFLMLRLGASRQP